MMNTFYLDETDFGINHDKSFCSIDNLDGEWFINVEVQGEDARYSVITENEDSEWSWTLYPPRLYIHNFPLSEESGVMRAKISVDDLDEYEVAIYLIEHNDVDHVELFFDGVLQVRGTVFLSGHPHSFSIHYTTREKD